MTASIPTPGSREAGRKGCTCPVMDNSQGKGFEYHGETQFWITEGCPLHRPPWKYPEGER